MLSEFEILYKIVRLENKAVHTIFGERVGEVVPQKGKKNMQNNNNKLADRKLKFFVTYTKLTGDMGDETDGAKTNGITYFCVYPSNRMD